MVDPEKIEGLFRHLREYVRVLEQLGTYTRGEFLNDPNKIGNAKYHLIVTIECCIDICNHIISSEGYRAPQDYRDVFRVLHERGAFPDEFTQELEKMVGFRNRLVHMYGEIDDEKVYEVLQQNLEDFNKFTTHIMAFSEKK